MLTIAVDEVVWVEAAGNYVQIYTPRKTHLVRHTVKAMEGKLDPRRFVRVRPSAIVAVESVRALNARAGGDYTVVLDDGTEIRTSRSFRDRVEDRLADVEGTARNALTNRRRRRERAAIRKSMAQATVAPPPPSMTKSTLPTAHGQVAFAAS
ncbi:MAG: LytTR family DNA-binding domain-containing protein [Nannocystaceae bacterium]